jgi:6-phosphofructokinase 1
MTINANAIVGQSGGPTSVINASLLGVIEECQLNRGAVGRLYGAINGIEGLLAGDIADLYLEDPVRVRELRHTPGAALGGCRCMLRSDEPDDADIGRIFKVFAAHNIRYFFYIGGNDSMDTAMKLDSAPKNSVTGCASSASRRRSTMISWKPTTAPAMAAARAT